MQEKLTEALNPVRNTLDDLKSTLARLRIGHEHLTDSELESALALAADKTELVSIESGILRNQRVEPLMKEAELCSCLANLFAEAGIAINLVNHEKADSEQLHTYFQIAEHYRDESSRIFNLIITVAASHSWGTDNAS